MDESEILSRVNSGGDLSEIGKDPYSRTAGGRGAGRTDVRILLCIRNSEELQ